MLAVNPRLIYCSIWAFGHRGPLKLAPGFDPLLQCYGAVVSLTGRPEDPPTFCAPAINDTATGMWCVIGALAALKQREATGKGCVVDTSLFESAVAWVQGPLNSLRRDRQAAETARRGQRDIGAVSDFRDRGPADLHRRRQRPAVREAGARDGPSGMVRTIRAWPTAASARRTARHWSRPCNRFCWGRARRDWLGIIGEAGVPVAPVNDIAELAETEQLQAMDMMRTLPGSDLRVVGLPMSFDRQRPHPRGDSPKLGQHNTDILGVPG